MQSPMPFWSDEANLMSKLIWGLFAYGRTPRAASCTHLVGNELPWYRERGLPPGARLTRINASRGLCQADGSG